MKYSKEYYIDGKRVVLYTLGELCNATFREHQTLRKWEKNEIIPPPSYKDDRGRRLYTKGQIKLVKELIEKYNVRQGASIPEEFIEEIWDKFYTVKEE